VSGRGECEREILCGVAEAVQLERLHQHRRMSGERV
jgi:hypothetical protein